MTQKYIRNRNTWLAYILISLYGYFLNILGPISPFLIDEFGISYTVSSLHSSAFAAGILLVGLAGERVIRALGRWMALGTGALGLGFGALLLVIGRSPVITVGATFVMGAVGSFILALVPTTLSDEHGELRGVAITEANVLASTVSALAPFLVGWFAGSLVGWRLALILAALLSLGIGGLLLRRGRNRPASKPSQREGGRLPVRYWYYWTALVLAVSVEFCMVLWAADFMERVVGLPKANASQTVSLFLAGMIVGRAAGSLLLRSTNARRVVILSILVGLPGFLLFWLSASPLLSSTGLFVTGVGAASLYPVILSIAIGSSPGLEAQAGARATLASGTAILALPLLLARLADGVGLHSAFGLVGVLLAALLIMLVTSVSLFTEGATHPGHAPRIR